MTTIEERRAAVARRHPTWVRRTVSGHFAALAAGYPDRPLVMTDDRTWTYAEMVRWARDLAKGLMALGLARGDHVAVVMANHPELVALRLGIAFAGGVSVPINTMLKRDELGYLLRQSDSVLLVTMDGFRDGDYLTMLDELGPGWEADPARLSPALRQVVVFDGAGRVGDRAVTRFSELVELGRSVSDADLDQRHGEVSPDDLVDIVYTSGTTGLPKGVMLTHDNVLRCSFTACLARAMEDGRRLVFALPMYHNYAHIEGFMAMSWVAGAVVPQLQFDPLATLQAIEKFQVNEPLFVPTMTLAVLEHPRFAEFDLGSLTAVMSAAAPAPVTLWEEICRAFGVTEVTTAYGQTELASSAAYKRPEDPLVLLTETVGRLKPRSVAGSPELDGRVAEYRTIDPVTLEFLPDGQEGEFVARGPERMRGYYNKPEETEAVFLPGGWMRTGDLGYIRADGNLALTGRSKELYKCGGELVAPKEIEELLTARSDVSQAYVVGIPDVRMGEVGCAYVVPAPGATWTPEELIEFCRERLARFKVPRHVVAIRVDELPTTATGKIQKFVLAERAKTASLV
ncbi:acyl--CoA ligase [Micromonospora globispora]|uniref:AMP-binding protein n=1 Tax=Micromonospora globispora TaxID=1450148 RepID=UPI000D6ED921|nr:AMP-binding protein [Micromonospora globispora]PWU61078.1 acyl--CoA ligase [Micromonospora globispora]RQW98964.1 acyl--CoA ligase [Micromonospora globispora]